MGIVLQIVCKPELVSAFVAILAAAAIGIAAGFVLGGPGSTATTT